MEVRADPQVDHRREVRISARLKVVQPDRTREVAPGLEVALVIFLTVAMRVRFPKVVVVDR